MWNDPEVSVKDRTLSVVASDSCLPGSHFPLGPKALHTVSEKCLEVANSRCLKVPKIVGHSRVLNLKLSRRRMYF